MALGRKFFSPWSRIPPRKVTTTEARRIGEMTAIKAILLTDGGKIEEVRDQKAEAN